MLKNYRYRWLIVPVAMLLCSTFLSAFQNTIVYLSTRRIVAYTNGLDEPKSYALENFNPISFKIARSQVTISAFVNDMVVFNGTNGTFQRFRD